MRDLLLTLGQSPGARSVVRTLGLPVTLPTALRRATGPLPAAPLTGRAIAWAAHTSEGLAAVCVPSLRAAGARVRLAGPAAHALRGLADAGSAPVEKAGLDGLVLDVTGAHTVDDLMALQAWAPELVRSLRPCARVVFLTRTAVEGEAAVVASAFEGVMRSLAKELGRRGATANLLRVDEGAEVEVRALLPWLVSDRLAFVDGQPLHVRATGGDAPPADLTGKTAVVTGAARGIGAATVRALAALGAHVVCMDREPEAEALGALAREVHGSVLLGDVTVTDMGVRILDACDAHGGLDILVHNAGITRDRTFARMTEDRWSSVLDVNLAAILRIHAQTSASMNEGGRLIGLASVAGIAGNPGQTAYAATKAGLIGWARAESVRLAPRGITVNAIAPGFIETKMTAKMPVAIREAARRLASLNQGGLPEDVASAIAFLASPAARGISGQTLRVCGQALIGA